MSMPGDLVRIRPYYEGYGCHGLGYIIQEFCIPATDLWSDIDDGANGESKIWSIYVNSLDRIMNFHDYEFEVISE